MSHKCTVKHDVPRQDHHHTQKQDQHHCTRTLRATGEIYFWLQISVLLQDLMPRHPPQGSAATHKMCWWLSTLSMYTVIAALRKQGFFHSCWYAFWKVQSKPWKRTECALQTHFIFFSIVLQLQSSLVCMSHPGLSTSPCPHHAVHPCISAQGCRNQRGCPSFLGFLKFWHLVLATLLTIAAEKNRSSIDSSQKVW